MPPSDPAVLATRIAQDVERLGILLQHDARLPSVSALVAGEPVRASWWGHGSGGEIFHVLRHLHDRDDLEACRLIGGKLSFVHRRLWPALLGVATGGGDWQQRGLPAAARQLLRDVEAAGSAGWRTGSAGRDVKQPASELERRLLVASRQEHTESGHHARVLESWDAWRARRAPGVPAMPEPAARAALESAARALEEEATAEGRAGCKARLPWDAGRVRGPRGAAAGTP
jgi:hypothetical protein